MVYGVEERKLLLPPARSGKGELHLEPARGSTGVATPGQG